MAKAEAPTVTEVIDALTKKGIVPDEVIVSGNPKRPDVLVFQYNEDPVDPDKDTVRRIIRSGPSISEKSM